MTLITQPQAEDIVSLFTQTYDAIPDEKVIDVSPRWYRQNFRLSGATSPFHYGLKLTPGEVFKAVDIYDRRVIFVGTADGTIVLYEESVQKSRKPYFAYDTPANFRHTRASKLNAETFKGFIKHTYLH